MINTVYYQKKIHTPIGDIYLVGSERGLRHCYWTPRHGIVSPSSADQAVHQLLLEAEKQLNEYLQGHRLKFAIPLDVHGSEFQKKVWGTLLQIPYGEVCHYGDIARKLNSPKAFQAVGTAIRKNPLCLFIPCHRVIRATGDSGEFSGGVSLKKQLLELEQENAHRLRGKGKT